MVDMKILDITGGRLASEGFEANGFGVEHFKDDLFSESHNILQSFLFNPPAFDYSWSVEFVVDHDATEYPDVFGAWTNSGGDPQSLMTVAKLPELGKWGVGFGGKKNGERAAKLALAASIAMDSELTTKIAWEYPKFGELLGGGVSGAGGYGGDDSGGGNDYGGGKSSGKGGKSAVRASPYGDAGKGGGKWGGKGGGEDGGWEAEQEMGSKLMEMMGGKLGNKGNGKMGKLLELARSLLGGMEGGEGWGGDEGGGGWQKGGKGKDKGKGKGGSKGKKFEINLNQFPAETKVWIGNLPGDTTQETLKEHFAFVGLLNVEAAVLMPRSTGCVVYQTAEEASQAIEALNGTDMGGQIIQVDVWSKQ